MELTAASEDLDIVPNGNPETAVECDNISRSSSSSSDSDRLALIDPENMVRFKTELLAFLDDLYTPDQPWDIAVFEGYGRGMVATRDIEENELIFLDRPILLGPRLNNYDVIFCASCCRIQKKLTLCSGGCRLPVCPDCDISAAPETPHTAECRVISSWEPKDQNRYCKTILYALTSIRGFLLDNHRRSIVLNMEAHPPRKDMTTEVERIIKDQVFKNLPEDSEDVQYLRKIVNVLNTNAFETSRMVQDEDNNDHEIVLRGLYILGALMNHCCLPNIRYVFDGDLVMRCYASKPIRKGEQIFNNYSKTLWGTQHRIIHLCFSKHFLCSCDRCRDPTEMGTYLGALKCVRDSCPQGRLLSMNPLKISSMWQCDTCGLKMSNVKVTKIQEIAGRMILNNAVKKDAAYIVDYLNEHVAKFLPPCNQFTVELKLQAILKIQDDAELALLVEKDKYCREILELLRKLGYGECYVKGVLCYELFKAWMTIAGLKEETFPGEGELGFLRTAWIILGCSGNRPRDLAQLAQLHGCNDV